MRPDRAQPALPSAYNEVSLSDWLPPRAGRRPNSNDQEAIKHVVRL